MKSKLNSQISIGSSQILGNRSEQEDSFATLIKDGSGVLAVVADGMGGYSNGKRASSLAVNSFVNEFEKIDLNAAVADFLHETILLSNQIIISEGKGDKTGTTVITALIRGDYLYWASVGDSALILFRNGDFTPLNKKHVFESLLEEEYLLGKISKEEITKNPRKKRLTSFLGYESLKEMEICPKPLQLNPGDQVILCSDGVYNSISEIEIEEVFVKNLAPQATAEAIMQIIKGKRIKKQDNATIVILKVAEKGFLNNLKRLFKTKS